jgi:AAA+ ATPase superfamily predicted ATPase
LKDEINAGGKPLLGKLFNFMVRLTKETHLCHVLCATGDCLFIEDVYNNARLEGRARYILVDDLSKESAFRIYKEFGFEDKELVWEYIGGKIGDMVILFEEKEQGYG